MEMQSWPALATKRRLLQEPRAASGAPRLKALAKVGAHLIVHYGRAASEADALVAGIRAAGGSADAAQADLSMAEGAATLAKQVRAIVGQRLDIFVANAGVSKAAAIEEHTIEDFDNLFATNVRSPFFSPEGAPAALQRGIEHIVVVVPGCSCCTRQSWATGHFRHFLPTQPRRAAPGNVGQALGLRCSGRAASRVNARRSGSDRNRHV